MDASSAIKILISATDDASDTLKGIGEHMQELGDSAKEYMGDAFKQAAEVGTVGLAALGEAAKQSIDAANEYNTQLVSLQAELKSTKDVSGQTQGGLQDMADQLEANTGITHDAILQAENMELTFTGIGKDVFPSVTNAALDMATAMNGGAIPNGDQLQQTMIMLGKAMNDPATGMSALKRVGVDFSASEQDQIKTMEAHNDVMGAQKVMLAELTTEFGGRAAAAGDTWTGTLAKMNNTIEMLKEEMGNMLTAVLTPLINKISAFAASLDWDTITSDAYNAIQSLTKGLVAFFTPVADFLSAHSQQIIDFFKSFGMEILAVVPTMAALFAGFELLTNPLVQITAAIVLLTAAWKEIQKWWESSNPVVAALKAAVQEWGNQLKGIWSSLAGQLIPALQNLWNVLSPVLMPVLKTLGVVLGVTILAAVSAVFGAIKLLVNLFSDFIKLVTSLSTELEKLVGWLGKVTGASGAINSLVKLGGGAITSVENAIQHRATGGTVSAGSMYNVNEKEPEYFVPSQGGSVVPLSQMPAGTAGGNTVHVHLYNPQVNNPNQAQQASEQIGRVVVRALQGAY